MYALLLDTKLCKNRHHTDLISCNSYNTNKYYKLTTVNTFLKSLCKAETSTPRPASPNLLSVSARGPDRALSCCQERAYCRRTNSIIVDVRANPIRMYSVQSNIYLGLSVITQNKSLCKQQ